MGDDRVTGLVNISHVIYFLNSTFSLIHTNGDICVTALKLKLLFYISKCVFAKHCNGGVTMLVSFYAITFTIICI